MTPLVAGVKVRVGNSVEIVITMEEGKIQANVNRVKGWDIEINNSVSIPKNQQQPTANPMFYKIKNLP